MARLDSGTGAVPEKRLQALVAEAPDHCTV
jgi:hypothetical protein